jgi:hypothetical protein
MIIDSFEQHMANSRPRVSARVRWEDGPGDPFELFFETQAAYAEGFECNPDAFLIGATFPAWVHGERRLRIDAGVDPQVIEGLYTAMQWQSRWWFSGKREPLSIEARPVDAPAASRQPRAGMFFSGGVDSLSLLRTNRQHFDPRDTMYIKDGLIVFGLETEVENKFAHVLAALRPMAQDAGMNLIPVYTNLRQLEPDWRFWERHFHDAVFASIAHVFAGRFSTVSIAATYDIPNIHPYGTHPLLTTSLGGQRLQLRHDGTLLSRTEKLRQLSGWEAAFHRLRVCNQSKLYAVDQLNCGQCVKCVRTLLELASLGLLDQCRAFSEHTISAEAVDAALTLYPTTYSFYEGLIDPLIHQGRHDLARVVRKKLRQYFRRSLRRQLRSTLTQMVKEFDKYYLNGWIAGFRRNTLR